MREFRERFAPGGDYELVGRTEAAKILGVSNSNIFLLKDLPKPIAHPKCGPIWLVRDLEAFVRARAKV